MRKTVASGPKTPRIHDQVQLSVVGCRAESAQVRLGNVPRVPHAPDLPARRASPTSAFGHRAMMAASMPPDATAFNEDKALMTGLASKARGPVDQLEDRYLGMVEAVGSNPTRSIPITVQNPYFLVYNCLLHATKRRRQVANAP